MPENEPGGRQKPASGQPHRRKSAASACPADVSMLKVSIQYRERKGGKYAD